MKIVEDNIELNTPGSYNESTGVQNFTIREQIAQETFDMTAGGSGYLPQIEPVDYNTPTIEELCYGHYPQIANPQISNPVNAIDQLYGRRLPDIQIGDAVDVMNGVDLLKPKSKRPVVQNPWADPNAPPRADDFHIGVPTGKEPALKAPCGFRNTDGSFNSPRNKYYNILFKNTFQHDKISNDCNIHLFFKTSIADFDGILDISECCSELAKKIWCNNFWPNNRKIKTKSDRIQDNSSIGHLYFEFQACIEDIIHNKIKDEGSLVSD